MSDPTAAALDARCRALLGRYLHRHWSRVTQAAGAVGDLFVTLDEAAATLQSAPPALGTPAEAEARLVAARSKAAPGLARLTEGFGLSPVVAEAVGVLAALQASAELLRLATFAWADFAIKQPSVGFWVALCADTPADEAALIDALRPGGRLRATALVRLGSAPRWTPPGPLTSRPITVPEAVWRSLTGGTPIGEDRPPAMAGAAATLPRAAIVGPDAALRGALAQSPALLIVVGEPGSGRRTRVTAGLDGAWVIDDDLRLRLEAPPTALTASLRDAALAGAPLGLVRFDAPRSPTQLALASQSLAAFADRPLVLTTTAAQAGPLTAALPQARVVELGAPDALARARLYARLVAQRGLEADARDVAALAETHAVPPRAMARALAELEPGILDPSALDATLRRRTRTQLGDLATRVETRHTWADLVLTDEQRQVVDEIIAHARHRARVFQEWGFDRTIGGKGRGLACLFTGPPGTGKTMTAALIGAELGLDVYQVDLARVVDKYVGETEKNLARLFDEASRVPVVLLFDEADALFAARTGVDSANDRYANLEVNFLLQRMEAFEGISVLTTNKGTAIDAAFKRRLRFRVHFDLPDVAHRRALWAGMVPPGCMVADDLDWAALAARWEISGAIIRNAMLRAAFLAAARDAPIDLAMLTEATQAELYELGRLPT